ncbi:MAG: inorganic phosphate transporter [Deltaproteobacteria bacterium]|nr:inorganic phosphate transporter [Deltaproteobacteria bacterium]
MFFWIALIIGATLFVAYANGANDNFKGVATLFGSGTTDYREALWWATGTTLAGSLAAFFLAAKLIPVFQGKGLVPTSLAQSQPFLAAVILGAALTVFLATKIGIPISTTHSLTGALFGSGFVAVGFDLGFDNLINSFFLPLFLSPLVAVALAALACPLLITTLRFVGLTKENCICIGNEIVPVTVTPEGYMIFQTSKSLRILVDRETECVQRLSGTLFGVNGQSVIDLGHFLSAGAVSFARGLNDTPKIVALGLVADALNLSWFMGLVAVVMAVGGLVGAKKVAETMSQRITTMDAEQGFLSNLVTSFLVIFASIWGLPVSTTHVSCGALFGIGVANGKAEWGVIRTILLAWLLTLPVAAILAGGIFVLLQRIA